MPPTNASNSHRSASFNIAETHERARELLECGVSYAMPSQPHDVSCWLFLSHGEGYVCPLITPL
jgi:hypothetical protein